MTEEFRGNLQRSGGDGGGYRRNLPSGFAWIGRRMRGAEQTINADWRSTLTT
jgi:hypothetical protein